MPINHVRKSIEIDASVIQLLPTSNSVLIIKMSSSLFIVVNHQDAMQIIRPGIWFGKTIPLLL